MKFIAADLYEKIVQSWSSYQDKEMALTTLRVTDHI